MAIIPKIKYQTDTIKLKDGNEIQIDFAPVEPGRFIMGSELYDDSKPIHEVTMPQTYYIGKYPVTQALWVSVMGDNPSRFKGKDNPVEKVSWDDVQTFLERINKLNSKKEYRLLSESEWEYAARGGTDGVKENLSYAGSQRIDEVGWYDKNSNKSTKPVGLKFPNQLGIYDMSGNVWEWCQDDWEEDYKIGRTNKAHKSRKNTDIRVVRGGFWGNNGFSCHVGGRLRLTTVIRSDGIGFRLCRY